MTMSTTDPTQVMAAVGSAGHDAGADTAQIPVAQATHGAPERALATLEARDVSCWFGDHMVLDRVSLTMPAGGITALIGPSGCGKSTFLRTLNRMHELVPSAQLAGEVLLDGKDVYAPDRKLTDARREIGMVFQKPNPFPAMSIRDNVLAGLKLTGTKASRAEKEELVVSSSGCASRGRWRSSRACCSWTSPARPSTRPPPA
jgi:phosphate transport system ATP-binding protein